MSEKIIYYSVTLTDDSGNNPAGLARRRKLEDGGIKDEMLSHDFSWRADSLIVEWRRGDAVEELHEISQGEAEALIERFREKWL